MPPGCGLRTGGGGGIQEPARVLVTGGRQVTECASRHRCFDSTSIGWAVDRWVDWRAWPLQTSVTVKQCSRKVLNSGVADGSSSEA